MYDLIQHVYIDAVLQKRRLADECGALVDMVDRSHLDSVLLLADRGYESYNVLAHIQFITSSTRFDFLPKHSRKHDPTVFFPLSFRIEIYNCATAFSRKKGGARSPGNLCPPYHVQLL